MPSIPQGTDWRDEYDFLGFEAEITIPRELCEEISREFRTRRPARYAATESEALRALAVDVYWHLEQVHQLYLIRQARIERREDAQRAGRDLVDGPARELTEAEIAEYLGGCEFALFRDPANRASVGDLIRKDPNLTLTTAR
jgi:hypothetical protein